MKASKYQQDSISSPSRIVVKYLQCEEMRLRLARLRCMAKKYQHRSTQFYGTIIDDSILIDYIIILLLNHHGPHPITK